MEDNTKLVETPTGHKAVLKTVMTARDFRELRAMWFRDITIEGIDTENPDKTKLSGMKGSIIEEVENKAIELMIVSLDDSTDDILKRLLDLPLKDYDVIFAEVQKMTEGLGQKKTA